MSELVWVIKARRKAPFFACWYAGEKQKWISDPLRATQFSHPDDAWEAVRRYMDPDAVDVYEADSLTGRPIMYIEAIRAILSSGNLPITKENIDWVQERWMSDRLTLPVEYRAVGSSYAQLWFRHIAEPWLYRQQSFLEEV